MRLTATDRALFIVTIALLTYYVGLRQEPQRPPASVQPAPPRDPADTDGAASKERLPIQVRFGDTFEDARILRLHRVGDLAEEFEDEQGRHVALRLVGAGIRVADNLYIPTDEEFAAWLALPNDAPFADDLDGYIGSVRK